MSPEIGKSAEPTSAPTKTDASAGAEPAMSEASKLESGLPDASKSPPQELRLANADGVVAPAKSPRRSSGKAANPGGKRSPPTATENEKSGSPGKLIGELNPLDLVMPPVLLTEQQSASCLVKVGDQFPELKLPVLGDGESTLKALYGPRLTLIVFFKASNPYAIEELNDLTRTVAPQFAADGVKVVGVDVQDSAEKVKSTVEKLGVPFPLLLDTEGKAFRQLATAYSPRTYAVDASGKIVWFDIEYSRSTRRDLRRAMLTTLHTGQ